MLGTNITLSADHYHGSLGPVSRYLGTNITGSWDQVHAHLGPISQGFGTKYIQRRGDLLRASHDENGFRSPKAAPGSSSGSDGGLRNVLRAACSATGFEGGDAALDFGEEGTGDTGSSKMPGPNGDGDAFDDTLLKRCQIGDDRVKSLRAELAAEFSEVGLLNRADPLETGDQIAEQFQARVEILADVADRLGHLHDALCAPVGRFERDDDKVARAKGGERDEAKPGRAVENDEIVKRPPRVHRFHKGSVQIRRLPLALVGNVEAGERRTRGEDIDVGERRAANEPLRLDVQRRIEEPLQSWRSLLLCEKGTAQVPLRISVDREEPLALFLADTRKEPTGVRLPDAPI